MARSAPSAPDPVSTHSDELISKSGPRFLHIHDKESSERNAWGHGFSQNVHAVHLRQGPNDKLWRFHDHKGLPLSDMVGNNADIMYNAHSSFRSLKGEKVRRVHFIKYSEPLTDGKTVGVYKKARLTAKATAAVFKNSFSEKQVRTITLLSCSTGLKGHGGHVDELSHAFPSATVQAPIHNHVREMGQLPQVRTSKGVVPGNKKSSEGRAQKFVDNFHHSKDQKYFRTGIKKGAAKAPRYLEKRSTPKIPWQNISTQLNSKKF